MRGLTRSGDGFSIKVDNIEDVIRRLEELEKLARSIGQETVGIGSKIILSDSKNLEFGKALSFIKKDIMDYPENTPLPIFVRDGNRYKPFGEGEITHVGHSRGVGNTHCTWKVTRIYAGAK